MRALSWLKDLISSERGNVFVVAAAVMPLLLGSAAFAIDTIQLSVWKRQLQRAADSSAIAGAYAVSLGDDTHDRRPSRPRQERLPAADPGGGDRRRRPATAIDQTVRVDPDRDPRPCPSCRSSPTARRPWSPTPPPPSSATAHSAWSRSTTARTPGSTPTAMPTVNLGCGMKSNCTGDECVTAGGYSSIKAAPIAAVGGLDGDSQQFRPADDAPAALRGPAGSVRLSAQSDAGRRRTAARHARPRTTVFTANGTNHASSPPTSSRATTLNIPDPRRDDHDLWRRHRLQGRRQRRAASPG